MKRQKSPPNWLSFNAFQVIPSSTSLPAPTALPQRRPLHRRAETLGATPLRSGVSLGPREDEWKMTTAGDMARWKDGGLVVLNVPCGKHTRNYGKSPFWMGKSTISMAIFNSFLFGLPEGRLLKLSMDWVWNAKMDIARSESHLPDHIFGILLNIWGIWMGWQHMTAPSNQGRMDKETKDMGGTIY